MKRDFLYIIKRVIIGILIGLFFIMFKSCNVNASALPSNTSYIYTESDNCIVDTNSPFDITCNKGTSYKFYFDFNETDNNSTYLTPMILNNNNYSVYFKNIIYDIRLNATYTIDNAHRSFFIEFPYTSSTFFDIYNDRFAFKDFPHNSTNLQDKTDVRLNMSNAYSRIPYYCSYFDTDLNIMKVCDVILDTDTTKIKWIINLPVGTNFNRFVLYFGTNQSYSGASASTGTYTNMEAYRFPDILPFTDVLNRFSGNTETNLAKLYGRTKDNLRSVLNNNTPGIKGVGGVWWYPKGVPVLTPEFTLPDYNNLVQYNNTNYTINALQLHFSNDYTIEQQTTLNNTIESIENDLEQQQPSDEENGFEFINSGWGFFLSNTYVEKFTGLFSSLFTYPLTKVHDTLSEDLVKTGTGSGSGSYLNDGVCWGRINDWTTKEPHKVYITKDYYFNFPCPHVDIYPHLKSGDFGFYPNTFHGIQLDGSNHDFYTLYQTVLDGLLVYFLFVQVLEIYKYVIDPTNTQVEVLEL